MTDLRAGALRGVSLAAARGEILGLAGLEGSGQREVLRAVFERHARGEVTVDGRVAFVSGDRAAEGIFPLWSIDENIAVSSFGRLARRGLISRERFARADLGMVRAAEDPGAVRRGAASPRSAAATSRRW